MVGDDHVLGVRTPWCVAAYAVRRSRASIHRPCTYVARERTGQTKNERTNPRSLAAYHPNDRTTERTHKRTNERANERTNKRTNDRTNERTNERTKRRKVSPSSVVAGAHSRTHATQRKHVPTVVRTGVVQKILRVKLFGRLVVKQLAYSAHAPHHTPACTLTCTCGPPSRTIHPCA